MITNFVRTFWNTPDQTISQRDPVLGLMPPRMLKKPWTRVEVDALGTIADQQFAKLFGRSLRSVYQKRFLMGIPPFRGGRPPKRRRRPWTPAEERMLGTDSDGRIAKIIDRHKVMVCKRRHELGIAAFRRPRRTPKKDAVIRQPRWSKEEIALLGLFRDGELAERLARSRWAIGQKRRSLGIVFSGRGNGRKRAFDI